MVSLIYIINFFINLRALNYRLENNQNRNKWIKLTNKLKNKVLLEEELDKIKKSYWKLQFNKTIDEFIKYIWKKKYNGVIKHVNSNLNYFYWKKNNDLVSYLNKYKMVIINLECFFNYSDKKLYHSYYLDNILKYCNYNNIPCFLIGELHPNQIIRYFLDIIKSLSLPNYLSPFHYERSKKIKNNRFNNKSDYLNVNKMIKDLLIENKINKKNVCYLGNNLTNYSSFQLCFD